MNSTTRVRIESAADPIGSRPSPERPERHAPIGRSLFSLRSTGRPADTAHVSPAVSPVGRRTKRPPAVIGSVNLPVEKMEKEMSRYSHLSPTQRPRDHRFTAHATSECWWMLAFHGCALNAYPVDALSNKPKNVADHHVTTFHDMNADNIQ